MNNVNPTALALTVNNWFSSTNPVSAHRGCTGERPTKVCCRWLVTAQFTIKSTPTDNIITWWCSAAGWLRCCSLRRKVSHLEASSHSRRSLSKRSPVWREIQLPADHAQTPSYQFCPAAMPTQSFQRYRPKPAVSPHPNKSIQRNKLKLTSDTSNTVKIITLFLSLLPFLFLLPFSQP